VQCWGLAVRGQTIGKRLFRIQVVDQYDRPAGFVKAVLLRSWVFGFLVALAQGWTGPVGALIPLLDVLLIFGPERRCLHDYLAGTRVRNTVASTGSALPALAVFGAAALALGGLLAKVGVNLRLSELQQVAARPGVLPGSLRAQVPGLGAAAESAPGPSASGAGQKDVVNLAPKRTGTIWRYEDGSGATQFTDEYEAIPAKYRAKARPIE
jgi:hypothetical protein